MKRIKADFQRGAKSSFEFRRRASPPVRRVHQRTAQSRAPGGAWIGAGIGRAVLLAAIVMGGVGAVVWIRDLATAVGVQWLGGG
jgi:hypothetical protein